MLIFLDFDGVLHPVNDQDLFQHMPRFLNLLDEYPQLEIVISSSWRHVIDFDVLKSMLERHGSKLLGVTRNILTQEDGYGRMHEILCWIEDNKYIGPWLAIDDSGHEFPIGHPNLFLCDPELGLDDDAIIKLRQHIESLLR